MAKKETLPGIRLNKYISDSGFCSRREADKLITDERVTINGHLATLGSRVEEGDKVKIDGEPLHYIPMEQREYKLRRYGASSRRNSSFGAEAAEERSTHRPARNRAAEGRESDSQGGRRTRHAAPAAAHESGRRRAQPAKPRAERVDKKDAAGRSAPADHTRGRGTTSKSRPDEKRRRG